MFTKILRLILILLTSCYLFYLLMTAVFLPFGLKWGIEHQLADILKRSVKVSSVTFNPFLWRLDIQDLKLSETDGTLVAGFDHLGVDASFLALFKKTCRFESVELEGLSVNVALLKNGRLNLMDLIPVTAPVPGSAMSPPSGHGDTPKPMPVVIVDIVNVRNARINFIDRTVNPALELSLREIDLRVTGFSTSPEAVTKTVLQAKAGDRGKISAELDLKPFTSDLSLESSFSLDGFGLDNLTPYAGKYTGRALKDGILEFKADYRINGKQLTATHKLLIQRFAFGDHVESKDALSLPFGLVVALLEDAQGRIKMSLPVTGDMSKPDFHFWSLLGQVVNNFFTGLVTKPFGFLASALGADSGTDELGFIRFIPGSAGIPEAEKEKIIRLLGGLKDHPKLRLEVNGGYDPDTDWKAIKLDTLNQDYAQLRKTSTRSESALYQLIYQRRVGLRELWDLTKRFKRKDGGYDDDKLVDEIKRQLIGNDAVDKKAMESLAALRAKAVYKFIMSAGFDSTRLSIGPCHPQQASLGSVPTEFTLTVFDANAPVGKIAVIEK